MPQLSHITTSGGLLSTAFVENIRQPRTNQRGTQPDTFDLPWLAGPAGPAALETAMAERWESLLERWDAIATDLPMMDLSQVRDRWLLPLLRALDFQPVYQRADIVLDDSEALRFNISHFGWPDNEQGSGGAGEQGRDISPLPPSAPAPLPASPPPIHTVPPATDLDTRPVGAANSRSAKGKSPHDMVQLFLNVSRVHRWAVLTNGLHLRLLRDYHHTYNKGYIAFDLESIFETRNFADFRALYRMAHASRFVGKDQPAAVSEEVAEADQWETVPLESFYRDSQAAGIQVGADLQKQVREAIETLGNGFLRDGGPLLARLQAESGLCQQFYAELLHLIYRILFLLYAEQRGMVPRPGAPLDALYRHSYSLTALRGRAESDPTSPEAFDLWEGLKVTFTMFQKGAPELGVYRYNGMLFAEDQTPLLDGRGAALRQAQEPERGSGGEKDSPLPPGTPAPLQALRCRNHDLLRAIRALTLVEREGVLQRISYLDLNVEEIGGIYESLLDFAPRVTSTAESVEGRDLPPHTFFLDPRGTARKTSGSYYTHPSLVNALIESALMPVLEDRLNERLEIGRLEINDDQSPRKASNLQSLTPEQRAAAENAILSLKVCDPAMGSGHFLIAANNALALRLAQIRSGDEYPSEQALRRARRDVLAHCIYGVDLNPMAVELGKVALWINAAVDDAPLSFLDHHLKCGNSLIGATPELLEQGIPDDAFQPVTGDDKSVASAVRRRNKQERSGQLSLWRMTMLKTEADLQKWRELNDLAEDEPRMAERRYAEYRADPTYRNAKLVADLWTAAFFWPLAEDSDLIPTEELFRQAQADPALVPGRIKAQAAQLAEHHNFFHWHQEFPDVFGENGEGGFDVLLGNPPWERIKLQETEFFAHKDPAIANAPNAAARRRNIEKLYESNPTLYNAYIFSLRTSEATSNFLSNSGHFPLTGRGDVNTYQIFTELARDLISKAGRSGVIVPSGIATDNTTRYFFQSLIETSTLVSLYDFWEIRRFFAGTDSRNSFCLLTMSGLSDSTSRKAKFVFSAHSVDDIRNPVRNFGLTASEIALINPNTLTCPIFQTRQDAELTRKIYDSVPVLMNEMSGKNPWKASFSTSFHMSSDSGFFRTREQLGLEDFGLTGNCFIKGSQKYLPLYEAKMIWHYDHRYGSFETLFQRPKNSPVPTPKIEQYSSPSFVVQPWYWVPAEEVHTKLRGWNRDWLIGFRDVTNAASERTAIFSVIPRVGAGNNLPIIFLYPENLLAIACAIGAFNSLVFDWATRQKIAGSHMNFFLVKQLPVLPPDRYNAADLIFILPRVLELIYTAWDIKSFADDIWQGGDKNLQAVLKNQWEANQGTISGGKVKVEPPEWMTTTNNGIPYSPFTWNEERRATLRAELDAYYGHLYGLTYEELRYILDPNDVYGPDFPGETFRVLREKEIKQYGEYRTRRLVLEAWEQLGLG